MTKAKFLKEAQAQYKEACAKKWVAEMNFIFSPQLILRVWLDPQYDPNSEEGDTGYRHRWCPVDILPCQADQDIIKRLGEITCDDNASKIGNDERDKAIVEFLRNADENTLNEMAHGFEFTHEGRTIEIIMWENCDHFTLRSLAKYIGVL